MTSFTTVKNCFSIKQSDGLSTGVGEAEGRNIRSNESRKEKNQWFLLAKDELELHEWVTCISAHVHVIHMASANYNKTVQDYLSLGTSAVSFWQVPLGRDGIHKLPVVRNSLFLTNI